MKRIKKFESFATTHRMPRKINLNEWDEKCNVNCSEQFTQKEIEFFLKLKEENDNSICDVTLPNHKYDIFFTINDYFTSDKKRPKFTYNRERISISKREDEWYLIKEEKIHSGTISRFICDQWDEVLGYLESKNLKF